MEANRVDEFLIAVIAEESGVEASTICFDDDFESLSVDSLDFALIVQRMQQKFGSVGIIKLASCETVGDLSKLFQSMSRQENMQAQSGVQQ